MTYKTRSRLALVFLTILVAGYLGRYVPIGDTLAIFRVPVSLLAVFFVICSGWSFKIQIPVVLIALFPFLSVMATRYEAQPTGTSEQSLRVYQKNILTTNRRGLDLVDELHELRPDIILMQEADPMRKIIKVKMNDVYRYTFSCFSDERATAVLSKWPVIQGTQTCLGRDTLGAAGFRVNTPQGLVWVFSIHLYWPWPARQPGQLDEILQELQGLEGDVIIGGDFNMMPWGYSVKAIERATGTRKVGALMPTRYKMGLPVSIDHVLASVPGRIETRPYLGSDHLGVLAEVFFEND